MLLINWEIIFISDNFHNINGSIRINVSDQWSTQAESVDSSTNS